MWWRSLDSPRVALSTNRGSSPILCSGNRSCQTCLSPCDGNPGKQSGRAKRCVARSSLRPSIGSVFRRFLKRLPDPPALGTGPKSRRQLSPCAVSKSTPTHFSVPPSGLGVAGAFRPVKASHSRSSSSVRGRGLGAPQRIQTGERSPTPYRRARSENQCRTCPGHLLIAHPSIREFSGERFAGLYPTVDLLC